MAACCVRAVVLDHQVLASHAQVGVGAFVFDRQSRRVLMVQERNGPLRGKGVWKMPTGKDFSTGPRVCHKSRLQPRRWGRACVCMLLLVITARTVGTEAAAVGHTGVLSGLAASREDIGDAAEREVCIANDSSQCALKNGAVLCCLLAEDATSACKA